MDPLPSFLFTSSVLPFDSKTQFCVQCNSHDGLLRWFHILDPLTPFPGGAFCLAFCCRSGLSTATQPFSFSFPSRVPSLSIVLRLRASFALRRSAPDFELPPFWPHVLPFRPWFGNLRYSHYCTSAAALIIRKTPPTSSSRLSPQQVDCCSLSMQIRTDHERTARPFRRTARSSRPSPRTRSAISLMRFRWHDQSSHVRCVSFPLSI